MNAKIRKLREPNELFDGFNQEFKRKSKIRKEW